MISKARNICFVLLIKDYPITALAINIKKLTPAGNAAFKMDHCLDTFCAEIHVRTRFGYDCKIERIYGYEM